MDSFRLPALTFAPVEGLPPTVEFVWRELRAGRARRALGEARAAEAGLGAGERSERAALLVGLASALFRTGDRAGALRAAARSLDAWPAQWAARRLAAELLAAGGEWERAYEQLSAGPAPGQPLQPWDEPVAPPARAEALAACACRLKRWDAAALHLRALYPGGAEEVSPHHLEDWVRVSLLRGEVDEAARGAHRLIEFLPGEATDALLQMFVQQGWIHQAVGLYREAFRRAPEDELLRRRLVGLCVRSGSVEEARRLLKAGPVSLTAG